MQKKTRIEKDSMGEIEVPEERLFGAQTQRSLQYFAIGKDLMPAEIIWALGVIKKAAALVNHALGKLDKKLMQLIVQACDEVISGKLLDEFPLVVWQTGSGTQTNMNVNEVIANRANQLAGKKLGSKFPIHPNDHVNMSQSSNDVFPTAMHIVAVKLLQQKLLPALEMLYKNFAAKQKAFANIVKIGRTHLQDATPMMLGQEFSGYAALLDRNIKRIKLTLPGLLELAIGGSTVGTGLNVPPHFVKNVVAELAKMTGLPFKVHPNKFAALSAHDEIVFASSVLRVTAGSLMKIANDIRWLSSGPSCGLNELILPANEPGSSIMPGKTNPTQCEALIMVATQVMANDVAIGMAGSQGNFELNVTKPMMIFNLINSITLLSDAACAFATHCIAGLKANKNRLKQYVNESLMIGTALNPIIGYDKVAEVINYAAAKAISLRDTCIQLGILSAQEFDAAINRAKI
jgi:fumarate hydratase, class II